MKIVPLTSDAKVMGMKACSLNDTLHILKELEYTLLIVPHLEEYYFIYCMYTYLLVGFSPPMLNVRIFIEDFECMWKIHDKEFQEYLGYNILCSYISQVWCVGTIDGLPKCICVVILLQVGGGIQQVLFEAHHGS
jgi:hypothetical protein